MRRFILSILSVGLMVGLVSTSPAQALARPTNYVALGDSVAAGLGLAGGQTDGCGRSGAAYPYQVAASLHTTVTQLACSGAKVDEGLYGAQTVSGSQLAPQLQVAFMHGTPDLVTVTIGANDARWTRFIQQCYIWKCGSKVDDVAAKVYRADLRIELSRLLYQIYQKSDAHPPRVLLSGYYAPIGSASCSDVSGLTAGEKVWINQQSADLNQAIESVVPYFYYAQYVPVSFSGHELCTASPWVQGLGDPAPFHPTAAGQTAIARAFVAEL